jgi:secreted PhoX family phosphatase
MTLNEKDFSVERGAKPGAADTISNPTAGGSFGDILALRYSRRDALRGLAATGAVAMIGTGFAERLLGGASPAALADGAKSQFTFAEITHGVDETHHVAPGYSADVLIRWGDPVTADAPAFDPARQTAAAQAKQFGYNCDFIGYFPLPRGSSASDSALLGVNHEYTNHELMFPGLGDQSKKKFADMTKDQVDIEIAAHGASIVEVRKGANGKWSAVPSSRYNRRITGETPMTISGPAAGHDRLKTKADPTGRKVLGMFNNCAGGQTPWGTYLTAEENFHGYFGGDPKGHPDEKSLKRYGVPGGWYGWTRFHDRFDIDKEPNEANRFGWVVEIDPYDPQSVPVKRTAMGRFKHEGAETIVNGDGRVVVYSGDDERFEYLYRFVTSGRFDPANPAANRDLLDSGTLEVAKFNADGTLEWLPLVHGKGPLTAANGFGSQADVLIDVRLAADLLGPTKMDRPEDVDPNPKSGKVYAIMTNNTSRKPEQVDPANPRANNVFGHIIEIAPTGGDHAAPTGRWEIFIAAGDPKNPEHKAQYHPATSANGWFAAPDNCTIDGMGRLWVATDQGTSWDKSGTADGVWAVETEGSLRGYSRMFFRVPVGAEMCGPKFAPDARTLFVAVQHPSADGTKAYKPFGREATFEDPATRWPDFKPGMPPRPSVVAITKNDGGAIGG